ncbi:MAG: alpha/beta fold hydrolase [Woeseia sp.]
MSKSPKAEKLFIEGSAGRLEALLESPQDGAAAASAVVCHPHPEHGGTMQNKVVHTLARAFIAKGFSTLRFNFRGVGQSEGKFDDGQGELLDALAAVQAMKDRGRMKLWVAGFSFGAAIAIRAAAEARADGLVSVAPAISRISLASGPPPQCPWLIVQGDRDELVDVADTIEWANGLEPGPELQIFQETEHFFHGKLAKLRDAVESFIDEHSKNPDKPG